MLNHTENISRIWAKLIIKELVKNKVDHFFVSAGKRNLPLISALSLYEEIIIVDEIDERSAAFMALGHAKATGKPPVLICTSGSALSNYYPAVLEASKSNIPLIIVSADRPNELITHHANQTIDQKDFFKSDVVQSYDLQTPNEKINPNWIASIVCHLLFCANKYLAPVHLNVPLIEPLDGKVTPINSNFFNKSKTVLEKNTPFTTYLEIQDQFLDRSLDSNKTLFVFGDLSHLSSKELIERFIKSTESDIFLDITSGLKHLRDNSITHFDSINFKKTFDKYETIIQIGSKLTSNKFYKHLENFSGDLIHVNNLEKLEDPSASVSRRYFISPNKIIFPQKSLIETKKSQFSFDNLHAYSFAQKLMKSCSTESNIVLGNSTTIRAFDLINFCNEAKLFFQRGTSGIEGNLSLAQGIALGSKKSTTLVLGDISLFHNLNAFIQLTKLNIDLNIFILNNHSGGIFKLLNLEKCDQALEHILSPHEQDFSNITKSFNLPYLKIKNLKELNSLFTNSYPDKGINIFEVEYTNEVNKEAFQKIINHNRD